MGAGVGTEAVTAVGTGVGAEEVGAGACVAVVLLFAFGVAFGFALDLLLGFRRQLRVVIVGREAGGAVSVVGTSVDTGNRNAGAAIVRATCVKLSKHQVGNSGIAS